MYDVDIFDMIMKQDSHPTMQLVLTLKGEAVPVETVIALFYTLTKGE